MSDDNKIALPVFAALVAKRAKVGSVEADAYIHQLAKTISGELESGGDIHLYHFGRFHTTHVNEQAGHNPNSGAPLTIPEHSRVHFRAYAALRLAVNAPFSQLRIRELTQDKSGWRTRPVAWILLLLLLLLILFGIWAVSSSSTNDASVAQPVKATLEKTAAISSNNTEVAQMPVAVPAAPIAVETTPTATGFVVSPGDTLWAIAASRLGDSYWWPIIYAENRPALSQRNPDLIDIGITLRIPVLAGSVNRPKNVDLQLKENAYQIVADDYRKLGNPRAAAYKKEAARLPKE